MNEAIEIMKPYTFRKLESTDTFLMFKIIGKIGIKDFISTFNKDDMTDLFKGAKDDGAFAKLGISVVLELANLIVTNIPNCETEIYQLLSNTSNLSVDEVKKLDFATFMEMIVDFIKKEEFKDFIKVVSKLFSSEN